MGAKRCGSSNSLAVSHEKNFERSFSSGTTQKELTMPAMLNVLDGAMNVMLQCAAFSETEAKGWCLLP